MENTQKTIPVNKANKNSRLTKGDIIFEIVNCVFLGIISAIILYPLVYVVSASISDPMSVTAGKMILWPVDMTLENYGEVFKNDNIMRGYRNSLIIMFGGTSLNIVMTVLAAFPMTRKDLWGRNVIMKLMTFCMFFGGGLIPTYLMVGKTLGLMNNWLALILPGAISVYNMIIMRTFFMTSIPYELHEAADIDGCSPFMTLVKIILPLSGPIIAVMALYYGVGHWNSWFPASIYLTDNYKLPIQNILRSILIANSNILNSAATDSDKINEFAEAIKYSAIVLTTVPVLCIYPFLQKYFVKGVMVGAVKG